MRKLIILISLFFIGCTSQNVEKKTTNYVVVDNLNPLQLVIIDSCEYLFGAWGDATVLTHKGNCKNH